MIHGTPSAYRRHKCRCEFCVYNNTQRILAQKARRALCGVVPEHVHGTVNGYHNWSCRCQACVDAMRKYYRERYREQRERKRSAHQAT